MPAFPPTPIIGTALNKAGKPCAFVARRASGLCINHDPAYHEQQRLNARKGAAASVATRRSRSIRVDAVDLSSRVRIQALLDAVIRLELLGRIPPSRSRNLIRALSLAGRTLAPATEEAAANDAARKARQ